MNSTADIWQLWDMSVCTWYYYDDDGGWFETGCDLDNITIDMGPNIRFCPGCGKPIDCLDFGGASKAADSMRLFEASRAARDALVEVKK